MKKQYAVAIACSVIACSAALLCCVPAFAAQTQATMPVSVQAATQTAKKTQQAQPTSVRMVPTQDALTQCLVGSTSAGDKRVLVKWAFAVIAQHPDIVAMTRIDDAQRTLIDRDAAKVFERLLTEKCSAPLRLAIKQSGTDAISGSFQALVNSAASDLIRNPQVAASGAGLVKYLDMQRIMLSLLSQ